MTRMLYSFNYLKNNALRVKIEWKKQEKQNM